MFRFSRCSHIRCSDEGETWQDKDNVNTTNSTSRSALRPKTSLKRETSVFLTNSHVSCSQMLIRQVVVCHQKQKGLLHLCSKGRKKFFFFEFLPFSRLWDRLGGVSSYLWSRFLGTLCCVMDRTGVTLHCEMTYGSHKPGTPVTNLYH